MRFFRNLRLVVKLTVLVVLAVSILMVAITIITSTSTENLSSQMGQDRVVQEVSVVQSQFEKAEQEILAATNLLASRPGLVEAVASRDAAAIRMIALIGAAPLDLNGINVVDSEGVSIVTTGDETSRANPQDPLISLGLLGVETTGAIVEETESTLWLAAITPLRDASGSIVGALLITRRVDDEFLEKINFARTDVHLALIAGGRIVAQDFPTSEWLEESSAALLEETAVEQTLRGQTVVADDFLRSADSVPHVLAHAPLTVRGETVATIGVLIELGILTGFENQIAINTPLIFGGVTLITIVLVGAIARRSIAVPLDKLRSAAEQMAKGNYKQRAEVISTDEIGQLADVFNNMADELQQTMRGLERRTSDMQQHAVRLQASAEVSRAAASILDADQLIRQVVELIQEQFGLYYVGLFLVDQSRQWAVLQAGTGQAGQTMLARGHRIQIGSGMIGWSIANAEARIALDVGEDAVRLATAELPLTRSEAALPLRSRGRVLGALTVQSDQPSAFDQETLAVWQTMADQVALALDNARLLTEAQEALEAMRRAYGEVAEQAWAETLHARTDWGYIYTRQSIAPAKGDWRPEMLEAAKTGQNVQGNDAAGPTLSIPLKVRDQVIGVISFQKDENSDSWTADDVSLLETLTEQLGVALESARLYQDTQHHATHERLTREITDEMRRNVDVEAVLRTAVTSLGRTLGAPRTYVRLMLDEERPAASASPDNGKGDQEQEPALSSSKGDEHYD
jgi:GAF domain-containing protein/HAMP domain-containing protein